MKITDPTEFKNFRYPHYVWRIPIIDPIPPPQLPFWALNDDEKRIILKIKPNKVFVLPELKMNE